MRIRSKSILDILISFLDLFIHPDIFKSDHLTLIRSRVIVAWVMMGNTLTVIMLRNFKMEAVSTWHPVNLTLYYCFCEEASQFE